MLVSRLTIVLLGSVLLMGGSLSTLADSDRARDTRSKLMQHDDRGRYGPHPRSWQDQRMYRNYRDPQRYRHYRYEDRGGYGQYRYDQRPPADWPAPRDRLGNERGESFNSERFYPDSPLINSPRGYPPPRQIQPYRDDFPRRNPHPPGIHRPLHDNGLQRLPPR
ncbi:MAG TPA: hypothetical protein VL178_14330 [Pseudomonas sp.]|jgi:hypothetical protein|nr:hypothetical protein [Pseudomonas sp.]